MSKEHPWVHVVGTGTIGEPIIYLLLETQKELGIQTISFHKRTPFWEDCEKIKALMKAGAQLSVDQNQYLKFLALGIIPYAVHEAALNDSDVIIDCTPAGNEHKIKHYFELSKKYPGKGFVAHLSEKGFGLPYAWKINDNDLETYADRFIQIARSDRCYLLRISEKLEKKSRKLQDHVVYGNFFMPELSGALLSSIAATLWLLNPATYREKMKVFDKFLFVGI